MNKITEILKSNKYAIMWTAAYIAVVWAILLFMFNFNIFVGHQWQLLMRAEIRGFAGFVFGILMLAALPMYIATTAIIVRTRKPLITINIRPVIKIFTAIMPHPVPAATPVAITNTDSDPQITDETEAEKTAPSDGEFSNAMPEELRGAFIRARQHIDQFAPSGYNVAPVAEPVQNIQAPIPDVAELPLPTDFNFDAPINNDAPSDFNLVSNDVMPTFSDINFDDDNDDNDTPPAPNTDNDNDDVINYLAEHGGAPRRDGNMIIANDTIIATHDDSDFWIADPETWFAAGKQKASPVLQLIKASAKHGLRPVLYLAQTNILELDTCRAEWDKMGVTSITDLSELPL